MSVLRNKISLIVIVLLFVGITVYSEFLNQEPSKEAMLRDTNDIKFKVNKSNEEWKQKLSPEQYYILREKGTERPYTGKFNLHKENGYYTCAACGNQLFKSDTKFDSHCGWPSFYDVAEEGKILEIRDTTHGMIRTEVVCANCGGHLGHVFNDGPNPTGLRYCINSVSLEFTPDSSRGK